VSANKWFLTLIERLYSKINTVTMKHFTYNWHNTYNARYQFNNCWVLVASQVTIHKKCSKYRPPESTYAWIRLIIGQHMFSCTSETKCLRTWISPTFLQLTPEVWPRILDTPVCGVYMNLAGKVCVGFCCGQWDKFLSVYFVFPCQYLSTNYHIP
jgi:hypothetical protein